MYLLGIHNGEHDAAACLFDDCKLVAAISLERLNRRKNAGVSPQAEMPLAAIDECLDIAGIARSDIDARAGAEVARGGTHRRDPHGRRILFGARRLTRRRIRVGIQLIKIKVAVGCGR